MIVYFYKFSLTKALFCQEKAKKVYIDINLKFRYNTSDMQSIDFKNRIFKDLNVELFSSSSSLNGQLVDNLIRVRKENNISQKELANICGLQQSNISRIETKKYYPSIDELNRIFNKLGYKVNISVERVKI